MYCWIKPRKDSLLDVLYIEALRVYRATATNPAQLILRIASATSSGLQLGYELSIVSAHIATFVPIST